jgi:hypothetical protein
LKSKDEAQDDEEIYQGPGSHGVDPGYVGINGMAKGIFGMAGGDLWGTLFMSVIS